MLEEVQDFYDMLFKQLKTYIQTNSIYSPYVFKDNPKDKDLFPLVVVSSNYRNKNYTTLKYTDTTYTLSIQINIFSNTANEIAGKSKCKELSNLIEKFFENNYRLGVQVITDAPNIDESIDRTIINVSLTLDTKFGDKLVIYPY